MLKSLIVVDDIYADPERIREAALRLAYPLPKGDANYAGRNSSSKLLLEGTDGMLSWVVGEAVSGAEDRAHGSLRLTLAGDRGRYRVHVDAGVEWSGVLYLSRPEHCRGGTNFFRHIATGTDRVLAADQGGRLGAEAQRQSLDRIIGRDSNDESRWETLTTIPMRFNRLVLFRPWLWHGAGEGFGDSVENGRLVQLFFLRRDRRAGP
jgi:hypothetical protein